MVTQRATISRHIGDVGRRVFTSRCLSRLFARWNHSHPAYVFGVDGDPTTLCYLLTVDKIGKAQAAHIHERRRGTNGPVVANLAAPADGNAGDCLTEGEPGKFEGGQTVAEILEQPRKYYVNVHNNKFPDGALRGQLKPER
ncbi:MAG TPA: CHRD domain-containing protein [Nocardioidaceae bacterium]|nr:CHRD domain-containing protein [Nocardioidaceae bacterium]